MFNNFISVNSYRDNEELSKLLEELDKVEINGFYRAYVVDNDDTARLGRVKIRIPNLHGFTKENSNYVPSNALPWATPAIWQSTGHDSGSYLVPNIGDMVFVTFEAENPEYPLYFGGIITKKGNNDKVIGSRGINNNQDYTYNENDDIKDIKHGTERVIYKSLKGATIMIDDYDNEELIKIIDQSGQSVTMRNYTEGLERRGDKLGISAKSKISMSNNKGDKITLKDNEIYLKASKVIIEADEVIKKGTDETFYDEADILDQINGAEVKQFTGDHTDIKSYHAMVDKILFGEQYNNVNDKL